MPDDLELSHWLRPDEQVRWTGRPARARIPWLPVIGMGAGSVIAGGVLAWTQRHTSGSGTTIWLFFLALIVVFNVANAISMVRRARTAAVMNRFVLTSHRAAVFEPPGHLVAEVRANTAEFRARRGALPRTGEIDWGESSYEEPPTGWRSVSMRLNPWAYSAGEGRVVFAELSNFEAAYAVAAAVRRDLGARTPDPAGPKERGEAPVALGALDSRTAGILNTLALCVGSIALACVVVLLGWTVLGPAEDFMSSPALLLFVLIFPLFFWAIAISIGRSQRAGEPLQLSGPRLRRRMGSQGENGIPLPLKYLPYWAIGAIVAVFVGSWISMVLVFGSNNLPGQPEYDAATHTYSANDHGDEIPLTKARYDAAVRAQDRLFLSVELAFIVVAVGAAADETIRRRGSPYIHPSSVLA
jgi:hypothetical protein